jgi:hypothetical protein
MIAKRKRKGFQKGAKNPNSAPISENKDNLLGILLPAMLALLVLTPAYAA